MKNYLIFVLLLVGCDQVDVSEKDIKKYPDIVPFVLKNQNFKGSHDMDLGWLHFSYQPETTNDLMIAMDSIAVKSGWEVRDESKSKRIYLKKIESYSADRGLDTLFVEYRSNENRLYFKWH